MVKFKKKHKKIKSTIFKFVKLKKQYVKKLKKTILTLKIVKKMIYQGLYFLLLKNDVKKQHSTFLISYIISFCFSKSNSIIQVSKADGSSVITCSAGLVDFSGKQKISRKIVLIRFLKVLSLIKSKIILDKPVALHLKNVGYHKHFTIEKLKNKFFIKLVKTFNLNSYNGCRKKKKKRKR